MVASCSAVNEFRTGVAFIVNLAMRQKGKISTLTSMHSSRMRTARCNGRPGVFVKVGGFLSWWGSLWPGGGRGRSHVLVGDVCPGGGGGGLCHRDLHLPPVNRMTHACENITLDQTSFAGGNKIIKQCIFQHCISKRYKTTVLTLSVSVALPPRCNWTLQAKLCCYRRFLFHSWRLVDYHIVWLYTKMTKIATVYPREKRYPEIECYELTRRCSHLLYMLASPLTYAVHSWPGYCKCAMKQN